MFMLCVRIVLVDDSLDCLISFTDFIYALQLRLYYDGEFCSTSFLSLRKGKDYSSNYNGCEYFCLFICLLWF